MTKDKKTFVPGLGYSKADWDAIDSPELIDEELASLRPAREVLPPAIFDALTRRKTGQRGPQKAPTKTLVSIRLDQDILDDLQHRGKLSPSWRAKRSHPD